MLKPIGGVIAGIVAWIIIVTILNLALRYGWHDYALVEKTMAFTLPMMVARLLVSGASSLASGFIAAWLGRARWAGLVAGAILLPLFVPVHHALWGRFPIWYHLTFLISLPLLSWLGGRLLRPGPGTA